MENRHSLSVGLGRLGMFVHLEATDYFRSAFLG